MDNRAIISNSWSIPIEKLMTWRNGWSTCGPKTTNGLSLRINYDQLLITSDTNILESFNMNQKMKGFFKDDIIILIIKLNNDEVRKIRFQIKSDVTECMKALGKHFPVVPHNGTINNIPVESKYRNIDEVLKHALQCKDNSEAPNLPADYANFIKICLLDPSFSQMVAYTEEIINKEILKK